MTGESHRNIAGPTRCHNREALRFPSPIHFVELEQSRRHRYRCEPRVTGRSLVRLSCIANARFSAFGLPDPITVELVVKLSRAINEWSGVTSVSRVRRRGQLTSRFRSMASRLEFTAQAKHTLSSRSLPAIESVCSNSRRPTETISNVARQMCTSARAFSVPMIRREM
jgi:hypothetical protein